MNDLSRRTVTGSVTVFGQPEQVGGVSAAWLEAHYVSSGEGLRDGIRARRQAAEAWMFLGDPFGFGVCP
jgi:hypothetical protein